jgi:AcrR family transcriptional regulator
VAARSDPTARILDGLLAALDRHGSQKVSMTDVCEAAGVSRGTIYRYFPTRDDLLAALRPHTLAWFRRAVNGAVDAEPALDRRVAVVVAAVSRITGDGTVFREAYRSDPGYVLNHFEAMWADIIAVLHDALAPAFAPGDTRVEVMADVLARHLLSQQLIRSHHTTDDDLVALLETYARNP